MSQVRFGPYRAAPAVVIAITIVLALVIYLLSVGPLMHLSMKGSLPGALLRTYRIPHDFVASRGPLRQPLLKYLDWWLHYRAEYFTIQWPSGPPKRCVILVGETVTVSGAVSRVGGFSNRSSTLNVKVIRKENGKDMETWVSLKDVIKKGMTHLDIPVRAGDVLVIQQAPHFNF